MIPAYYLKIIADDVETLDRIGGQPSRLPVKKPWKSDDDEFMGFLLQLAVDGHRLTVPGAQAIQLYQDVDIDDGANPLPKVVVIPLDAPRNVTGSVTVHPDAHRGAIVFERSDDPDEFPDDADDLTQGRLFKSKLGGLDPWADGTEKGRFLGQIHQTLGDFNFAGLVCSLYLEPNGDVVANLK